jgi:hypothetical protein
VVEAIKTGTYDTVMGPISFQDNINRNLRIVGQWHDGVFYGVAANGSRARRRRSRRRAGSKVAVPIRPLPGGWGLARS